MQFYFLDAENESDKSISIYCKDIEFPNNLRKMTIKQIISPYLTPSNEGIDFYNYFYENLPRLLKMRRNSKKEINSIKEFTSPLEQFMITKQIKGPGLITITNYEESVNGEIFIKNLDEIQEFKPCKIPELKIMVLKTNKGKKIEYFYAIIKSTNQKTHKKISYKIRKSTEDIENIKSNSIELIKQLNLIIKEEFVDLVLFYNLPNDIIKSLELKGRIVADLYSLAPIYMRCRSYSINELCNYYKITPELTDTEFNNPNILNNPGYNDYFNELILIYKIFFKMKILDICKEQSEICGFLLKKTIFNFIAERNEYLILHKLFENNILFPPKLKRTEKKYSGGLVLEPKKGFYNDNVVLLDFNSLYPSIILQYNICFSTINCTNKKTELAILPLILKNLIERRKNIKLIMKNEFDESLNTRQLALKLIANSLYGCLGTVHSRFCNYDLAQLITLNGRTLLLETKHLAEQLNLQVIYGDTDSIMIHLPNNPDNNSNNTNNSSINRLIQLINEKYNYIELEVEKTFKKLIVFEKKKYAGITTDNKIESRGLENYKRDICEASAFLYQNILEIILKDQSAITNSNTNINSSTNNFSKGNISDDDIRANIIYESLYNFYVSIESIPKEQFLIHSTLSKTLDKYSSKDSSPHISLANRLQERGIIFNKDDTISYIIGRNNKEPSISKRACLINDNDIDYQYYIENQIVPNLLKLTEHIKYIDHSKILKIFNLNKSINTSKFKLETPCCKYTQDLSDYCCQCNSLINKIFINNYKLNKLRESTYKLYNYDLICTCITKMSAPLKMCLVCENSFSLKVDNAKFDYLLECVDEKMYIEKSGYRIIDLSVFGEELRRYSYN